MELSQHFVYYRLSRKYTVRYIVHAEKELFLKRPIYYKQGISHSNELIIITADELERLAEQPSALTGNLFLCIDRIPKSEIFSDFCVIAFDTPVDEREIFNELQEIYSMFDFWDECMKIIYYENSTFQDLIDTTDAVTFDPISIGDKVFHYVAYSRELTIERGFDQYVDANNNAPLEIVNDYITGNEYLLLSKYRDTYLYSPPTGNILCKNIFVNENFVGRIMIRLQDCNDEFLLNYNSALLTHLSYYVQRLYSKYSSFYEKEVLNGFRNFLNEAFISKNMSTNQWENAIVDKGWSLNDRLQIVQFRPDQRYDKEMYADYVGSEIEQMWRGCIYFVYNNRLMLLVNFDRFYAPSGLDFRQALAYFLRDSLLIAGLSRVFSKWDQLYPAYKQTETAIEFGVIKNPTLWYFNFEDYVLDYMISHSKGSYEPVEICSEKLLTLKNHDKQKKSEYYKTLQTYFHCKFNAAEAAKILFIHRSSFLGRMDRIQKLVDINFDSHDELTYLKLSFELLKGKEEQTKVMYSSK